ncbi:hypothetical protein GCM10022223_68200 [Kineosporia mesophila]|uniref:Uncharacterized protein n=1 Tax=Kineosporia mesophila TaxID=566012 RepID=A0ABP7ATE6_9ACTN|nr:hypothetical protein [Kineosporia mesophila]MCD5353112.1 hypothetical protein [Kineosporia mesophila]
MSEFVAQIRGRAEEALTWLQQAQASGDEYLVNVSLDQIESIARVAADHQIPLEGLAESLSAYGLPVPQGRANGATA